MKSSVCWVVVFLGACFTHRKYFHRSLWPVVRNGLDDGKARTAVGAVDEGIVEPSVAGVEKFSEAVVTEGDIRWNCRVGGKTGDAWQN